MTFESQPYSEDTEIVYEFENYFRKSYKSPNTKMNINVDKIEKTPYNIIEISTNDKYEKKL